MFQAASVALPKLFDDRLGALARTALGVGGFVTAVYAIGSLAQIVVGSLIDRLALKPVYAVVNLLQVPLLLWAVSLSGLPLAIAAQLVVFLAMGAIPVADMLVAHYTPVHLRGRIYGMKFMLSLGVAALGVPLVGLSRDLTGGFSLLLQVMAALAAVVVLAVLTLPRDPTRSPLVPAPAPAGD